MRLTFERGDIQRWADFSSDRNPIHFEPERARALGLSDVAVHGMLVLLPLKQAVTSRLLDVERVSALGEWLRFKCFFKKPVQVAKSYQLAMRQTKSDKILFALSDEDDDAERVRGQFGKLNCLEAINAPQSRSELLGELQLQAAECLNSFNPILSPWIHLDALAFAAFVKTSFFTASKAFEAKLSATEQVCDFSSQDDVPEQVQYVQTTHECMFRTELLRQGKAIEPRALTFSTNLTTPLATTMTGLVASGSADISIWEGDQPLLVSTIGLLARTRNLYLSAIQN